MEKIRKVSGRFRVFFQIIFYLMPIFVFLFWVVFRTNYDFFLTLGIGADLLVRPVTINVFTRVLGFSASLIPLGVLMYGLSQLIKLFKNYEVGQIFTSDNANYYQKLGYTLFAWVISGVIYGALISFIVTFQNKPGYRVIAVSMSGIDVASLVTGGIVLIIAWVMKEACNHCK